MSQDFLRRNFASAMADGDYAVPSLANPVDIDPSLASGRTDFWGSDSGVGRVVHGASEYWGGIWDIMTGKKTTTTPEKTAEEAAIESQSGAAPGSGSMTYLFAFAAAIAALIFWKKGGL